MARNRQHQNRNWQKRYETAHNRLEDVNILASYQQIIDRSDPASPPTAHIFTQPHMTHRAQRVCILAGSFNPLTTAHLAVAEAAREAAQLDAVIWVYTAITVDKERVARASLPDRLGQLSAYLENAPSTGGNLLALLNRGLYVDQANAIHPLLGVGAQLFILVGFDKIVQIFDPRYYRNRGAALDALFAQAKLLVAPRSGAGEADLQALLARPENAHYGDCVRFIPMPPEYGDESSTEVRAIAARNDRTSSKTLSTRVTPEGMALIRTGAYAPVTTTGNIALPDEDDATDAYLWRQIWIRAHAKIRSPILWDDLPPLSTLVAHTVARDERGIAIRHALVHALAAPPEHIHRLLRATLAKIS